jgi:hypothetical protein
VRDTRPVLVVITAVVMISAVVLVLMSLRPVAEFRGGPECIPASVQDC